MKTSAAVLMVLLCGSCVSVKQTVEPPVPIAAAKPIQPDFQVYATMRWTPPTVDEEGNPLKVPLSYLLYDITDGGEVVVFEGIPVNPERPVITVPAQKGKLNKWILKIVAEGMLASYSNVAEADINPAGHLKPVRRQGISIIISSLPRD